MALDLSSAIDLGSIIAILQDLNFVNGCCSHLLSFMARPEDERDGVVIDALWSASVIAYARCFKDGKREHRLQDSDVSFLLIEGDGDAAWRKWADEHEMGEWQG
ncbi:hypothetical protein [Actinacidiphila oryziradicis]|uniref:Uncharacterized protein n=1 Tax=Actinacidiphila oryziradicis TaxID=2571141 RepID=A0A4U0RHI9_9ACTN|nr:hypothetical protein [Actinacidiphila oryziradicis]TJZ95069.1 hypothetical protein FCI23_52630 [Actinacidiphila oryziradicis]